MVWLGPAQIATLSPESANDLWFEGLGMPSSSDHTSFALSGLSVAVQAAWPGLAWSGPNGRLSPESANDL